MCRNGDPLDDFNRKDQKETQWLQQLPVCDYCNHPIQDDTYICFNDELICEDCLEKHFRKRTEDFVL